MTQLVEYIKMALANIRANKGRSFLTMLGIIIGISSVITIMSVGAGFEDEMNEQLTAISGGQIYLYSSEDASSSKDFLNAEDMIALEEEVEGITGVTPYFYENGTILGPKGDFEVNVIGGGTAQQEVSGYNIISGRYFNSSDINTGNKVCVLTKEDAIRAFGTDDVLGMNLEITLYNITVDMTIIGIAEFKNQSTMVSMMGGDLPLTVDIPYTAMDAFGVYSDEFYSIYITTDGVRASKLIAQEAVDLVERRHQAQTDDYYMIQDFNDQMSMVNDMLGMITGFISFVAAISLLVGGIGVMNIMLVSVTERTREIGIRKSLGAKTGSIMLQFLAESAIIAVIGGLIGIAIGIGLAYVVCSLMDISPGIRLGTILFATLFSSGIGIFFGIYPAKKAAKLNPIDALRRS